MPALVVPFTKMNGAGNDFVVLDNRFFHFSAAELSALARQVCPRRTGVGADGVLALAEPDAEGADFRMRYVNADGSPATMCGNGARCLARFARSAGIEPADGSSTLTFDTDAGRYRADVPLDLAAPVRLHVPPPRAFGPVALQDADAPEGGPVFGVWTGTEHAVLFVDRVEKAPLDTLGPRVRHDAAFAPAGTNLNVVAVEDVGANGVARVRARTFEKGVEGETLACGTGALAAALAARLAGRITADRVDVAMPGGTLRVGFALPDGAAVAESVTDLTLEGPAETTFLGTFEWAG